MTAKEFDVEIAKLRAENEALKAKAAERNKLTLKVSEKGGVSVYGLGKFPVTLYKEQWGRLIAFGPEITKFIEANSASLKTKAA